jgi:para-nitrobenzyl esterase
MVEDNLTVRTAHGLVRGETHRGVRRFLGIPYAAPPVGERRFELPELPERWGDTRDTTQPGAAYPQRLKPFPGLDVLPLIAGATQPGDDYLSLNVWTPERATGRPVLVWIHGGGFQVGSKDAEVQDGTAFARDGVVTVAINYRMGVDGFLPIPGVPTNLGLRDMLFALAWVRDNIAEFGGDPGNITIAGESAGAMAIADLISSPLAKGLFQRAIVQSGHGAMARDIDVAQRLVKKLAKKLKVKPTAKGFASATYDQIFDAVEGLAKPGKIDLRDEHGFEPVFGISRFVPVYGDDVLPVKPVEALRRGAGKEINLLIGSNAEEMNLYFVPTGVRAKMKGLIARWFVGKSMPRAGKALKAYGLGQKPAGWAMTEALHDLVFRWPARVFAEAHQGRTHMYEMEWRSPAIGGELGACHGIELPFVFDTLACATGPEGLAGENPPQTLADRTHALWVDFISEGALPWGEYEPETRLVYQLARGEAVHEPVMAAAAFLR